MPVRLEVGPRDIASNAAQMAVRNTGVKSQISILDGELAATVSSALATMHRELFDAASKRLADGTYKVASYADMKGMIQDAAGAGSTGSEDDSGRTDEKKKAGFYLVPWKCDRDNEAFIKDDCKATIRCYPVDLNQTPPPAGTKCFYSGEQATHMAIFARAF